ncbi:MAG: HAMP domain-containing protein [Anaerolineae bacterium]|nr:HAMP domain-containing protein [Anaerolineae bacterium]
MGTGVSHRRYTSPEDHQGRQTHPDSGGTRHRFGSTPRCPRDAQDSAGIHHRPRAVPTTGMRGGLGRTLLTAFLILTVVPLAVIGVYAVRQNRENIEREVGSKLLAIATLMGEDLVDWLQDVAAAGAIDYQVSWDVLAQQVSGLAGGAVLGPEAQIIWSVGDCQRVVERALASRGGESSSQDLARFVFLQSDATEPAAVVLFPPDDVGQGLVLCLQPDAVGQVLKTGSGIGETGRVNLVYLSGGPERDTYWPTGDLAVIPGRYTPPLRRSESPPSGSGIGGSSTAITPVHITGDRAGYALYQNPQGNWVIGGFYPLPGLPVGVLVEQDQDEVLASTERIVATLIALILAVALVTTAAAAIVIRQITRPVIDLTESAVAMAEGNLDQHLAVRSRDEIGILTFVFNEMATELKSLYSDLEAKVIERTKRLQQANYQIQRRALHLQASQEVSQAITSIRDPDLLLTRVTDLIRSHFIYSSVAVYLVAPGGGEARLQAFSPQAQAMTPPVPNTGSPVHITGDAVSEAVDAAGETSGAEGPATVGGAALSLSVRNGYGANAGTHQRGGLGAWPVRCWPGDGSVVGRAIRKGQTQLHNELTDTERGWTTRYQSRVAIPLKMADRTVGAVAVVTTAYEGIQHDELEVLEGLANQVTIALENARAYERERLAMEQMEAAEAFKARFLGNMSGELREPLNTIIGFSRLLIKGIDGPLNARQLEDLEQIHNDSQHLLFLVNDILSISQIQAGLMALRPQPVDLTELLAGIMPTASALVRGRNIALRQELPPDLPNLYADPARIRQVLVHLLNNAAKFTEAGEIVIRAWNNEDEVYVSISDTGIGVPLEDRERIFAHFEKGRQHERSAHAGTHHRGGIGLGLALCREYVELHGGRIWVDSEIGVGSTFTFSVPAYVPELTEASSGT